MLFLQLTGITTAALLLGAGLLHLIPRLGAPGQRLAEWLCRAPGLDLMITYFTALPMILGPIYAGWIGLGAGVTGQVLTVMIWTVLHELANRDAVRGPRIVSSINKAVGRWRESPCGLDPQPLAVPLFWIVRVAQYIVYPPITWLVRLPKYNEAEWVNVSRQEVQKPGRARPDLVPLLRLDDGHLVPWQRDASERRELLVPHPLRQRQEVRPTAPSRASPTSSRAGCPPTGAWLRLPRRSNRTTSGATPATRGSGTRCG